MNFENLPAELEIKDESLFKFIQTAAKIGVWEYDIQNSSVTWSDETKRIHGVPLTYIPKLEKGINFYREGHSRFTITQVLKKCIENLENFDEELQIKTAQGKYKWVRAIGRPTVIDNKCVKVIGLFQDIDKKTCNAINLANREKQLRLNFEHSSVGMAMLDLGGTWISVNNSLCQTFGYTKDEFLKLKYIALSHPDELIESKKVLSNMLLGKLNNYQQEQRYISKDGHIIYAYLSISLIRDIHGSPLHFSAQINNLTSLFKNKKKVQTLLSRTKKQNSRLLNFAHIVSHNLRSHVSNLYMLLNIAKEDTPKLFENEFVPMIDEAVNQLGETIENLNEVATITSSKMEHLVSINLLEAFNKVLKTLSALIAKSNAELILHIVPTVNIQGIPAYIDSILLNFITNSIKYKKTNKAPKIEITSQYYENTVCISIKDFGLGIDLNVYGNKLFGMYKTFHNHEDARGIGLFISKNQIEAIGGRVEVKSEVNIGTEFKIYLQKA